MPTGAGEGGQKGQRTSGLDVPEDDSNGNDVHQILFPLFQAYSLLHLRLVPGPELATLLATLMKVSE